jgi:hypothetical protein
MSSRKKLVLINLLLVIFSVGLGLVAIEFLLRTGVLANSFSATEQAIAEIRSQVEAPKERPRLLILGDSFIRRGHAVDADLKRIFNEELDILNLAYSGYSPVEYHSTLKNVGLAFKPDLVLLSYYVGNDLTDTKYRMRDGALPESDDGRLQPYHRSLEPPSHPFGSYLKQWVQSKLQTRSSSDHFVTRWQKMDVDQDLIDLYQNGKLNPWLVEVGLSTDSHLKDNLLVRGEENVRVWQEILKKFEKIHELARNSGAELAVVVFPNTAQINKRHYDLYNKMNLRTDPSMLSLAVPQDGITTFCRARGIPVLDLLPHYREKREGNWFWDTDDHMNVEGSYMAARIIADFLKEDTSFKML